MQAGPPVAPQTPATARPQLVQSLPVSQRTPVVVPQFNSAIAKAVVNGRKTAASGQSAPTPIFVVTANATSKTEAVDHPGSMQPSPAKRIEPSAILAGQRRPATPPIARNQGADPIQTVGRPGTLPTSAAVIIAKPADGRQQSPTEGIPAEPRQVSKDGPAPLGTQVAESSGQPPGADRAPLPLAQSAAGGPPAAGLAAPSAAETDATRRSPARATPRIPREIQLLPREPLAQTAPSTRPGSRSTGQAKAAASLPLVQVSSSVEPLTLLPIQGSPAAPGGRNQPPVVAVINTPIAYAGLLTADAAAANATPVAVATAGAADTAGRATVQRERRSIGDGLAPPDLSCVNEALQESLPDPAQSDQATAPAEGRPANVSPPPPTETAAASSGIAAAIATGVRAGEAPDQPSTSQTVRSEAAASGSPGQQAGPLPPLAKASATTQMASAIDYLSPRMPDPVAESRTAPFQTAHSTTRIPANHGSLTAAAPTQTVSQPVGSGNPTTATLSSHAAADGAQIWTSAQPPSSIAIDAGLSATPSNAPSSAITLSAPEDTSPTSRLGSLVAQMAPVLVSLGHASDGAQRLTMRLDPPELGHVQVRIDRPTDASARVEITVEKVETLTLLLRDQPQLQHALDLAGVPAEGRSVTFHVASPEPAPRSEPAPAPALAVAAGGPSGDGSHGASRNGGQPERHQSGATDAGDTGFTPAAPPGWARGGLDITA
jgi:flagellar hook-length control protein FliK